MNRYLLMLLGTMLFTCASVAEPIIVNLLVNNNQAEKVVLPLEAAELSLAIKALLKESGLVTAKMRSDNKKHSVDLPINHVDNRTMSAIANALIQIQILQKHNKEITVQKIKTIIKDFCFPASNPAKAEDFLTFLLAANVLNIQELLRPAAALWMDLQLKGLSLTKHPSELLQGKDIPKQLLPLKNVPKDLLPLFDSPFGDSLEDAYLKAKNDSRELHVVLGATPDEKHMSQVIAEEIGTEKNKIGFKAPVRIYIIGKGGSPEIKLTKGKDPVIFGDFNNKATWDFLIRKFAILSKDENKHKKYFNGEIDKIYFDWGTAKFASWDKNVFDKVVQLLKPSGELYITDAKLFSDVVFPPSRGTSDIPKYDTPHESLYKFLDKFIEGIPTNSIEKIDGKAYLTSSLNLVNDIKIKENYPVFFQVLTDESKYPNIGLQFRKNLKIVPFIKISQQKPSLPSSDDLLNFFRGKVSSEIAFRHYMVLVTIKRSIERHDWNKAARLLKEWEENSKIELKKYENERGYENILDVANQLRELIDENLKK